MPRLDTYRKWLVLVGLMFIYAASNGIAVHSLPLLYPELIDEFGWTTAQMTLPATAFFVFGAITSPLAGALLDRFSPRLMLTCGALGVAVSLGLYALATQLWQIVAIYLALGLALSFCGLTASMVVLTRWFDDLRGRATGLLLMSSSFGGAVFPLLLGFGVDGYGWRTALVMLAAAAAIMMLIPLLIMVRDKPPAPVASKDSASVPLQSGPSLREALRNPDFYLLAVATGTMWFSIVALLQHQSIHLGRDIGIDREILSSVFSVFFACSVFGKLGFGWISDIIDKELAFIVSIMTFATGLIVIAFIEQQSSALLFVYAALAGIGFSGVFTTIQLSIAKLFVGPSYGKILALLVMIDSLAGGLGTSAIAALRDSSDSYEPAFMLMIATCAVAAICVWIIWLRGARSRTHEEARKGVPS